jgi:3-mercaptopyruvate sulfurtransferase SseA
MKDIKKALFALLAVLAVVITIGYLWQTNRVVTPKEATWNDVLIEARQGDYRIISTDELWERYEKGSDKMLLVDTRQEWEYRTGHIKGALNFPMEPTWMSRWRNKGALENFLGPDKERYLVFY